MNRKSKIIVSVIGISIVLLALLGITYAYYLTRIEGNTNTNSISVTTADLKLKYDDGNGAITASDIMPGTEIVKTFTVTNEGESKVENYVVVLESVINKLTRKQDLTYTLECKLENGNSCGSTAAEGIIFPNDEEDKAIFLNSIDKDITHYYTLSVIYANPNEDQSVDMGKTFSALVNIRDSKDIDITGLVNPSEVKLLANEIINNAKANKNGTTYRTTPLTEPVKEITSVFLEKGLDPISYSTITPSSYYTYGDDYSVNPDGYYTLVNPQVFKFNGDITPLIGKYITNYNGDYNSSVNGNAKYTSLYKVGDDTTATSLSYGKVIKSFESLESTLSITQDNMGSGISYYFRGNVQDNYVLFNNMCFRIVRIEGDGSVKLILAGDVSEGATNCNEVGIDTGLIKDEEGSIKYVEYGHRYSSGDSWLFRFDYENNTSGNQEGYTGLEEIIEAWYTSKFTTDTLKAKLKTDKWCFGGNSTDAYDEDGNLLRGQAANNYFDEYYYIRYPAGNRAFFLKTTSLMCENENYVESKYGTITSDEAMLAGATTTPNSGYYLYDNAQAEYWTLSYALYDDWDDVDAFSIIDGKLKHTDVCFDYYDTSGARPSVTLIPGTTISSGDGTKTNPYVIN